MTSLETFLEQFCNALQARTPFVALQTYDHGITKRFIEEFGRNQLPSKELEEVLDGFDHVIYKGGECKVLQDGELVEYEKSYLYEEDDEDDSTGMFGGGVGTQRAFGGSGLPSPDVIPPNTLLIMSMAYRIWAEGERLDTRTSGQLHDLYEHMRRSNSVALYPNLSPHLPQDDEGLFFQVEYPYPSREHRAHVIRQYTENHSDSRSIIANEDGLVDWSGGLAIDEIEAALDQFAVKYDGDEAEEQFMHIKSAMIGVDPNCDYSFHEHKHEDIAGIHRVEYDKAFFSEELFDDLDVTVDTIAHGDGGIRLTLREGFLHPRSYLPILSSFCRIVFPGLFGDRALVTALSLDTRTLNADKQSPASRKARRTLNRLSYLCPALFVAEEAEGAEGVQDDLIKTINSRDWIFAHPHEGSEQQKPEFTLSMRHWHDTSLQSAIRS